MSLLDSLAYSTEDQRNQMPTNHKVPINGNLRTGSATLKQAVKLYMTFKEVRTLNQAKPRINRLI